MHFLEIILIASLNNFALLFIKYLRVRVCRFMNTDVRNAKKYFLRICQLQNTKRKRHIPVPIVKAGVYKEFFPVLAQLLQKRVD
jgi:hypothetical protein